MASEIEIVQRLRVLECPKDLIRQVLNALKTNSEDKATFLDIVFAEAPLNVIADTIDIMLPNLRFMEGLQAAQNKSDKAPSAQQSTFHKNTPGEDNQLNSVRAENVKKIPQASMSANTSAELS